MIVDRAPIVALIEPFLRVISFDVRSVYGLRLQGSWANSEYHATMRNNLIYSHSDLDFVTDLPLGILRTVKLRTDLLHIAACCNLQFKGISIRSQAEMENMWTFQSESDTQLQGADFIHFWVLIGAAEFCAAILLSDDDADDRQYYLNKFFLELWRDIGFVLGRRIRSHKESLRLVAQWITPDICEASYCLKLGMPSTRPWPIIESAYRDALFQVLPDLVQSRHTRKSIYAVIDSLSYIRQIAARCFGENMLRCAKGLEHNDASRAAAINRLSHKLKELR